MSVYMEIIIIGIVSLLSLLYFYLTSNFGYWKTRGVPYAEPSLLFGRCTFNMLRQVSIVDRHSEIYNEFKGHPFVGYFVRRRPYLLIRDPELIRQILLRDFAYFCDRGIPLEPDFEPLSVNLFNLKGEDWKRLRHKLLPTFSSGTLRGMFEQMLTCSDHFVQEVDKYAQTGDVVNIKSVISIFSTEVIASCAFGLELRAKTPEVLTFHLMMGKIFNPSLRRDLKFLVWSMVPGVLKFLGMPVIPKEVNKYFLDISKSTMETRKEKNVSRNDFIQLLIKLKLQEEGEDVSSYNIKDSKDDGPMTDELHFDSVDLQRLNGTKLFTDSCIAAQTFVFLTAGTDSTATTISFVVYFLAKHPEIQKRAQAEVERCLSASSLSYQSIKDMTYLDQIIQESLRIYPTAPFLSRECTIPYQLPGTDTVVEKGVRITIPVPSVQMDPNNFSNPEVFDPERFEGNHFKPSATYLPFGNGPRKCIAMRFALLTVKVCLARLLANFTVTLNQKTKEPLQYTSSTLTTQALGGIWITFEARNAKTNDSYTTNL